MVIIISLLSVATIFASALTDHEGSGAVFGAPEIKEVRNVAALDSGALDVVFGALEIEDVQIELYKKALGVVFGTLNPEDLRHMVEDPQKYFEERKAYLLKEGTLIKHKEFLAMFTKQTKTRCEELATELKRQEYLEILKEKVGQIKSTTKPYFEAVFYAELCDYLLFLKTRGEKGQDSFVCSTLRFEQLLKSVEASTNPVYPWLDTNMVWGCTDSGFYSMLDYLIVLSSGFHLGAVPSDVYKRDDFAAGKLKEWTLFSAHKGSLKRSIVLAEGSKNVFEVFKKNARSAEGYLCESFTKNNTHDIVEFAQKVLAAFATFHELAPTTGTQTLQETLLTTNKLPDLLTVVPAFMDRSPVIPSEQDITQAVFAWRDKYFKEVNDKYLSTS